MTPYVVAVVLPMLRALHETQRAPVPARQLAERVYASERTVQRWLRSLELRGLVTCVATPDRAQRGRAVKGWLPLKAAKAVHGRDGVMHVQYFLQGFEHLSQLNV